MNKPDHLVTIRGAGLDLDHVLDTGETITSIVWDGDEQAYFVRTDGRGAPLLFDFDAEVPVSLVSHLKVVARTVDAGLSGARARDESAWIAYHQGQLDLLADLTSALEQPLFNLG